MTDEIHSGQETTAAVRLCPECGSASIEQTTKGILHSGVDDNRATCGACGWVGIVDDLLTQQFTHEMGSDEKLVQTMVEDLRNVLAQDFAKSFGRFLMKWGFITPNVTPKELSQYIVAIAQATMTAILTTRRKLEQEKL
jgi:predicted RNA-binding Zn-ribbon protein involved in translation (DUF1610 family)